MTLLSKLIFHFKNFFTKLLKFLRKKRNRLYMYDPSLENPAIKKEIEIRGRYLMMSCDIEFSLLNIILLSNADPHNHQRAAEFKKMKMNAKIEAAICDIKKYKVEYYEEFRDSFDGLQEFRTVRNDMSHHVGLFPNSLDLSIFKIDFLEEDENGIPRMRSKEYTDQYITESLTRFAIINNRLGGLFLRLKREFESKAGTHPFVYPSIGNE